MIIVFGSAPKDLINYFKKNSYNFTVCVTTEREFEKMHKLAPCVFVDISSRENLKESVLSHISIPLTAVITFFERYIIARAWIGELFYIPSISEYSAQKSIDKILMRHAFLTYDPQISPSFTVLHNLNDAFQFGNQFGYPFMIKPANLQKSLLVTKIESKLDVQKQYSFIEKNISSIYTKENRTQEPRVLAEEFLNGSLHSVQTFANSDGSVICFGDPIDLYNAQYRQTDDSHIFARISPSILSQKHKNQLNDIAIKATKALRLTSTPGHVELILTKSGPKVVEVGPRIGGYRTRLYQLSQNLNLNEALVKNALGVDIIQKEISHIFTAIIELFPKNDGFFDKIANMTDVLNLKSYYYHSIKKTPSELIGLAKNGYRATCVIIIKNSNKDQFMRDFYFVRDHVHVVIKK